VIDTVYPFADALAAYAHLYRGPFGKIVIRIGDWSSAAMFSTSDRKFSGQTEPALCDLGAAESASPGHKTFQPTDCPSRSSAQGRGDPGGRAVEFAAIGKLSPY
jgi:hypothetical protein